MNTKLLRQRILDLAIRGKLVPQDPNDEPASVLLERIRAQKEQLVADGKIKKTKHIDTSDKPHYQNTPFDIPNSWQWVRLGEVGKWQAGGTPNRSYKEYYGGDIPWLKTGDLNDGYIKDIPESITQLGLEHSSAKLNPKDSVLIALYGATIGKVGILTFPATTNQACCACIDYPAVDKMYLFYFLRSHRDAFVSQGGGGAQPNISKEIIINTLFPLPPLAEQKRIVAEIERWFALIDDLEANKQDLQTAVKRTKAKVLGLAIHGKLVPQDPADEPAIDLLHRINPHFTPSDTSHYQKPPFDIPQSWEWVRLGEVVNVMNGYAFKSSKYIPNDGIRVIRISNVQDGFICDDSPQFYPGSLLDEYSAFLLEEGDLLMSLTGNVGRVGILPKEMLPAALNQRVACLRGKKTSEYLEYIFYVLRTTFFLNECIASGNATAQLNISTTWLKGFLIPFPPLAEQKRIVAKIESIFAQLDNITENIQ